MQRLGIGIYTLPLENDLAYDEIDPPHYRLKLPNAFFENHTSAQIDSPDLPLGGQAHLETSFPSVLDQRLIRRGGLVTQTALGAHRVA